jgi:alpha-beta hydrolase superfamily lysophospholipase
MARGKSRVVNEPMPVELGRRDGLAYSLWLPPEPMPVPRGVVILHGAGSVKESHNDFARALLPIGCAAIAFDMRGHGESAGPLDGRAIDDIATIAGVLREALGGDGRERIPVGLRGSSMGGFLSIVAAPAVDAAAVVAICPASAAGLARGLRAGRFALVADNESVIELLDEVDLPAAVGSMVAPLLLMHAEGDEAVPVDHSRRLALEFASKDCRLVTVPGGHHRSVQHDAELQAISLRFLDRFLR